MWRNWLTTRFERSANTRKRRPRPSCLTVESLEDRRLLAIDLAAIGSYETGIFDDSAAEIVAYDADTQRLFVTNSYDEAVDVLDMSDPTAPTFEFSISVSGGPSSVAVHGGVVVVAVINDYHTLPGVAAFFDTDGNPLNTVEVGANPDMITFTPNGDRVLVANEGQPNDDYTIDPEGSVSIIDIRDGVDLATVTTADFTAFNGQEGQLRADGVRIFGPGASVAEDLEPEYITVSRNSQTAWVTLQENNAIAEIDIRSGEVTSITSARFEGSQRGRKRTRCKQQG